MPKAPFPIQGFLFPEDRERYARSLIYGTPEWYQAYQKYIHSPEWGKKRWLVIARANQNGGFCERCNQRPADGNFAVHHLSYENFMNEPLSDLLAICKPCHGPADDERRQELADSFEDACEEARYLKARETFFQRKYGEDWRLKFINNSEEMETTFDRWMFEKDQSYPNEDWIGAGTSVMVRPY